MTTSQLQYFICVANEQSFTKAAKECYVAQTAITQQIQALESQLEVQLINRNTRPISLTPAGHFFYGKAQEILREMQATMEQTKLMNSGSIGRLRIGYAKNFENSRIPDILINFHQQYPNVTLRLFRQDSNKLEEALLKEEVDMIFTWDSSDFLLEPSISSCTVENITSVVVMNKNNPLVGHRSVIRSELKGEKIFFLSPTSSGNSKTDDHYIKLYEMAGFKPNVIVRTGDLSSILMMVSLEEGVAVIPTFCKLQVRRYPGLVCIPLTGPDTSEHMVLAWNQKLASPEVTNFVSSIKNS